MRSRNMLGGGGGFIGQVIVKRHNDGSWSAELRQFLLERSAWVWREREKKRLSSPLKGTQWVIAPEDL